MKWSWRIGRVAGIGIYLHATFLILLAWVVLNSMLSGKGVLGAIAALLVILGIFTIIVLHELGHALTAKRFGIRTQDITLLPIGGVARLERIPEDPKQEILIALAGPAVNGVLALALAVLLIAVAGSAALRGVGNLLASLVLINVGMALFNLLPAFPMDGGRVLRAFLARRMPYAKATRLAASIGQGMALLFGLFGLFSQPMLLVLALFLWIGAGEEDAMVQTKALLSGLTLRDVMVTEYHTLAPTDSLACALESVRQGFQHDFPVLQEGTLIGMFTRSELLRALADQRQEVHIGAVMQTRFTALSPDADIESVFAPLRDREVNAVPILENGLLVGLVTREHLAEFLMVQNALHAREERNSALAC